MTGDVPRSVLSAHRLGQRPLPRRVATLSVHTSPLDQPGTGDAGGMNVYVVEVARRLAALGIEVEIFTRATSSGLPPSVEMAPGVVVRHVTAGPYEGLAKEDLPAQLCAFAREVLRADAAREPGWYDVVHSHYWLSGQVGWLAKERWGVPLVHSMHTLAKVKNSLLAEGDEPEPTARLLGEEQVVAAADRLVANTEDEARDLVRLYDADPDRLVTVNPGVDLSLFRPGDTAAARRRLGLPSDADVLLFVGRIQPLKAPDVLLRAAARLVARSARRPLVVAVVGGPSGSAAAPAGGAPAATDLAGSASGVAAPASLRDLAGSLGISDVVQFHPPAAQDALADWYRAATLTVVPSYNESFGLVAVESQACGTPVVAASVGGLRTAVGDGTSGVLVDGHDPADYADVLARLLDQPRWRDRLAAKARGHASAFGWSATAARIVDVYADAMAEVAEPAELVAGR